MFYRRRFGQIRGFQIFFPCSVHSYLNYQIQQLVLLYLSREIFCGTFSKLGVFMESAGKGASGSLNGQQQPLPMDISHVEGFANSLPVFKVEIFERERGGGGKGRQRQKRGRLERKEGGLPATSLTRRNAEAQTLQFYTDFL